MEERKSNLDILPSRQLRIGTHHSDTTKTQYLMRIVLFFFPSSFFHRNSPNIYQTIIYILYSLGFNLWNSFSCDFNSFVSKKSRNYYPLLINSWMLNCTLQKLGQCFHFKAMVCSLDYVRVGWFKFY